MTTWTKTCKEFKTAREAIKNKDNKTLFTQLIAICDKYAKQDWEFADDYAELADDLRNLEDVENVTQDEVNFWLTDFYNLCDRARVWLEL